ncbi:hypothetical protein TEA_019030 [Camellia sinensis var. sinensis]|uniref:serine C-palmitoyltransferase n=1 Tax=Camellia sinensis var. sinensis TaxID=542762 RepID=A0A4S4ES30_CAMSN|nr:hypothetical protein TEA_019030 [Camellia sinensis var. sinensis]
MNTMESALMDIVNTTLDWVTFAFEVPFARAFVFGVHIHAFGFQLITLLGQINLMKILILKQGRDGGDSVVWDVRQSKGVFSVSSFYGAFAGDAIGVFPCEIDELCDEWVPESLIPPITEEMRYEPPVLESAAGPHTIINGKEVVNFASANYLGFVGHEKLIGSCTSTLEKYGVGSCSARGFYGTLDVHLDCEARIAKFLGTPDCILYSYGLSTIFSAIPAFSKKGDIIVADEGVHWGIQNGLYLSRSTIVYFKHNDMVSLQSTLEKVTAENKRATKLRRYIVVEAVYQNSGQIAPLDEIIRLKEKYHFRVLLDESNSFGVLGNSGRGITEHYGVPIEKVDIITAAMGHSLATEGGFCVGSVRVTAHQRLSSSGYVFSASLLPYLATAAITAIDVLEENPDLTTKLDKNIAVLHKGLSNIHGLKIVSDVKSPIVFLRLKNSTGSLKSDSQLLEHIAEQVLKEDSVFVVTSKRSMLDKCRLPVGIRLFVSASHSESDLLKASESLKRVAAVVLAGHD